MSCIYITDFDHTNSSVLLLYSICCVTVNQFAITIVVIVNDDSGLLLLFHMLACFDFHLFQCVDSGCKHLQRGQATVII